MKMDYILTHQINNYKIDDSANYDYVGSTIWFSKQELSLKNENYEEIYYPFEFEI